MSYTSYFWWSNIFAKSLHCRSTLVHFYHVNRRRFFSDRNFLPFRCCSSIRRIVCVVFCSGLNFSTSTRRYTVYSTKMCSVLIGMLDHKNRFTIFTRIFWHWIYILVPNLPHLNSLWMIVLGVHLLLILITLMCLCWCWAYPLCLPWFMFPSNLSNSGIHMVSPVSPICTGKLSSCFPCIRELLIVVTVRILVT